MLVGGPRRPCPVLSAIPPPSQMGNGVGAPGMPLQSLLEVSRNPESRAKPWILASRTLPPLQTLRRVPTHPFLSLESSVRHPPKPQVHESPFLCWPSGRHHTLGIHSSQGQVQNCPEDGLTALLEVGSPI